MPAGPIPAYPEAAAAAAAVGTQKRSLVPRRSSGMPPLRSMTVREPEVVVVAGDQRGVDAQPVRDRQRGGQHRGGMPAPAGGGPDVVADVQRWT
jgi:hypothetical protein